MIDFFHYLIMSRIDIGRWLFIEVLFYFYHSWVRSKLLWSFHELEALICQMLGIVTWCEFVICCHVSRTWILLRDRRFLSYSVVKVVYSPSCRHRYQIMGEPNRGNFHCFHLFNDLKAFPLWSHGASVGDSHLVTGLPILIFSIESCKTSIRLRGGLLVTTTWIDVGLSYSLSEDNSSLRSAFWVCICTLDISHLDYLSVGLLATLLLCTVRIDASELCWLY